MAPIRAIGLAVAALGLAVVLSHAASAQSLAEAGRRCVDLIDAVRAGRSDGGDAQDYLVTEYCPDIAAAITASRWNESLPPDEVRWLTVIGLGELVELERRLGESGGASAVALSASSLESVVERLSPFEQPPAMSLWDRFTQWLDEWLGSDGVQSSSWMEWLRSLSLPDGVTDIFVFFAAASIVVLALAVAVNEIRHARARRHAAPSGRQDMGFGRMTGTEPVSFDAIRALPPQQQPAALFAFVAGQWRRLRGIDIRDDQTHREAIETVRRAETVDAQIFGRIAAAAERSIYGGWSADGDELSRLWRDARLLVDGDRAAEADARS